MEDTNYGIVGHTAPEFEFDDWIDENGDETNPIRLSDFEGKIKVIYCFQSQCPGCHSIGFPNLKKLVEEFKGIDEMQFLAIQTVFEGFEDNTSDKIIETQKRYDLQIPFGHDAGDGKKHTRSTVMWNYRTGGTPWFVFLNKSNRVVSNGFHIDSDKAISYLKEEVIQIANALSIACA